MELRQRFLTENACYQSGRTIRPRGIMVHSLGVAQPDVEVFLRTWNDPGVTKCVHAFVTPQEVVQTLPWTARAWHAGAAEKGHISANNTHISFELCEPAGHRYDGGTMLGYDAAKNADYFAKIYRNATELCALLCVEFDLDPLRDVLCHSEGHARGIASNHADVMHWFPKHGKSMDSFRADVAQLMRGDEDMTQETFNGLFAAAMAAHEAALQQKTASTWADEVWQKAQKNGVFDGTKPQAPLTREQAAVVFERLKLLGE